MNLPTPALYAHRGAASERPENTLASFERAVELGVDVLETDLHLTVDGHIVVGHDPNLRRMTGVSLAIRAATLDDIRRCDAGWGFVAQDGSRPFAGRGLRVPTFEELLDAFPTARFNVDAKRHDPVLVEGLLALLRRKRAEERVLIASFDAAVLRAVRRAGYPGLTGLGRSEVVRLYFAPEALLRGFPLGGRVAQVPTGLGPLRMDTRAFIARCHALSLRVDYWTINSAVEAERLLGLGADGIMTDDPAAIVPVFQRLRARTGEG